MKTYYWIFFVFLFFISCDDVSNSPLIGKWQLKTVEKDGIITNVDTVWYNFQSMSLFSIQVYVPQKDVYYLLRGYRVQEGPVLSIELESGSHLNYSDWTGINRSFTIEVLKGSELVLISEEGYKYSFINF